MNKQVLEQEIKMWTAQKDDIEKRIKTNQEKLEKMKRDGLIGNVVEIHCNINDGAKRFIFVAKIEGNKMYGRYIRLNKQGGVLTSMDSQYLSAIKSEPISKEVFIEMVREHVKDNFTL